MLAAKGVKEHHLTQEAVRPTSDEGRRLMTQLLDGTRAVPTAVFAHNDAMAIGAMDVARRRGLRIPEDLSIAGYNDMPLTAMLTPGLTTVRYPGWRVGHEAADVAVRLIEGDEDVASINLDPEFVPRDSTAGPE
jgi:LacI family transcriptional regulator